MNGAIKNRLSDLTSAHLADACLRVGVPVRPGPPAVKPVSMAMQARGPVRPVRHFGSVDIFLESIEAAEPGDVLAIDNGGRRDEACIGDLVAIEAQNAGLAGLVVWGLHRDTDELIEVGLPVFSLGATPVGPQRLDDRDDEAFASAQFGDVLVDASDWVIGDTDGLIFIAEKDLPELVEAAESIRDAEYRQAEGVRKGRSLREQLAFADYLEKARQDPSYTLRQHLIDMGGAIET